MITTAVLEESTVVLGGAGAFTGPVEEHSEIVMRPGILRIVRQGILELAGRLFEPAAVLVDQAEIVVNLRRQLVAGQQGFIDLDRAVEVTGLLERNRPVEQRRRVNEIGRGRPPRQRAAGERPCQRTGDDNPGRGNSAAWRCGKTQAGND